MYLKSYTIFLLITLGFNSCSYETYPLNPITIKLIRESPAIPFYSAVPTPQQLEWQRMEINMFCHFGINTFTNKEWGDGTDSPSVFYPESIYTDQWSDIAYRAGFGGIILTAKHHDGFCLWPSAYTEYSVKNSPWQNGAGDILKVLSASCKKSGIKFGLYISPWDRHEKTYGTPRYNDFYVNIATEVLSNYGDVFEIWLDGANDGTVPMNYDWNRYFNALRDLQPGAVIALVGPDVRWVGNEDGVAPDTLWSIENSRWRPAESDVSIRPGWFYHASENGSLKTVDQLIDIYFHTVGRNCVLLLNISPSPNGRIASVDSLRLMHFKTELNRLFATNLSNYATISVTNMRANDSVWGPENLIDYNPETFWATDDSVTAATVNYNFADPVAINIIDIKEAIRYGQRIEEFHVDVLVSGSWNTVYSGSTIGARRLIRLSSPVNSKGVRLVITKSKACIAFSDFGIY